MDDVTFESGTGLSDCDTDEITGFLAAFNKITGAHIGIHDPLYAVAYASGGVDQNLCTYCKNRSLRFRDRCGCDDSQILSAAISSRRPHVFRCHLGVMSVIIPIMKNAQVSGVIDFGMIRPASDPMMEFPVLFKRLCGEYPESFGEKDLPAMLEAYHRTAVMDEDTLKGYITIVKAAAQGLLLNRLFLKPQARSEDRLKLYMNFLTPEYIPLSGVSVKSVAEALDLSYSHVIRLSKSVFGMPIKQYVLKRKIEYAADRLRKDPDLHVQDAAWIVGIEDAQYFSRLFRRIMGCSCSEYKARGPAEETETEDR